MTFTINSMQNMRKVINQIIRIHNSHFAHPFWRFKYHFMIPSWQIFEILMKISLFLRFKIPILTILLCIAKTLKNCKNNDTQLVWRQKIDINLPSDEYFPKSISTKPKNDQGKSYSDWTDKQSERKTNRQKERHWEL